MRPRLLGVVLLAGALPLADASACHRGSAQVRNSAGVGADSVQGVVRVVGVEARPQTVLVTDSDSTSLTLTGSPLLHNLAGLRVAVRGTRDGNTFHVARFAVVAANGVRAADGTLKAQGGGLVLITASGAQYTVNSPPAGLRADVGHRVWISGILDGQVIAYGVIDP